MNLLFTGASGFLGNNIIPIIEKLYSVRTLGFSEKDEYYVNLANQTPNLNTYFDIVLHAAGKAHTVPKNYAEEQVFFEVNLQGTKNLCTALEKVRPPKSFVFISTVAVYGVETGENITENHPLNGASPYALSKIKAEEFITDWCEKHNVILSIIRPSLIAGPNPPGNLGAMIDGIRSGKYLSIGGGKARKSVLMVEDIVRLIPLLAVQGGIYNVCSDEQPSFKELETIICSQLNIKKRLNIPYGVAILFAKIGDLFGTRAPINTNKLNKITKSLTFSNEKAKKELNWQPLSVTQNFRIY